MFCDLVGSTALSARLDPEDMREIIGAYQRCCAEQIVKAGGFVAKYMGDGVLGYFGYPQAHEDDAERAVRGALSLIETVPKLRTAHDAVLQVRVGIATGLVVVGDLVGEGDVQERGVVGDAPNLAARLQTLVEPGQIVISHGTRRLTGGLFEYRDLGRVALKGLADPLQAWQVTSASAVQSRFEAQHETTLTPLVGREEELELLLRRWRQAAHGEGRVVLLSGEPGIGKSRITSAIQERLASESHTRLQYFCSPHHQASALHPFIGQLVRAAGFERDDGTDFKLNKLEALLARSSQDVARDASLVAELLSIPTGDRYPRLDLSPQKRKEETLTALLAQLEGLAAKLTVLMVFEDAHWIDPTSLELLELTVDRVPRLPVLLIVTARPEFAPPWTGRPHVTVHPLNRLGRREGLAMIERLTGGHELPREVVDHIIARTDGVPLFIEELTKAVLDSGLLRERYADRNAPRGPLSPVAIPATLHASLMSRLDRLVLSARDVAQTGAAIGREFSYELVALLTGYDPPPLIRAIRELEAAGLIYVRGEPPNATCTFKHVLVQEAAYSTLLRGHRQVLHARIVDALEARSSDMVESQPEFLAQHCAAAGLVDRAVMYWGKAGQRAISRFALTEAIAHLTNALGLLRDLSPTEEHKQQELTLQIALGGAFIASKGHGADETGQAFARAYELGRELGDAPQLFRVLAGKFVHHHVRAEVDRAQDAARELLRLAEEQDDIAGQVMAHRALGDSMLNVGRFASARAQLERALSLFGPDASPVIVGEEIGVAALAFLSLCLATLGFPEAAAARSEEALERARHRVRHPHTLAFALNVDCRLQCILRNARRLQESSDELSSLAAEHGLKYMRAQGVVYLGCSLALVGRFTEAVPLLEEGTADARATGAIWLMPFNRGTVASAYQRTGRIEEARFVLDEVLDFVRQTHVEWTKAELYRLEADLALSAGVPDLDLAEASLRQAMTTAQQQSAKWWELRSTMSLARLWLTQGKRTEARDLLAPIYGWFTEGFDTPDLKETKALLAELA